MFPSHGHFRQCPCPYKGECSRPYCHFSHKFKIKVEKEKISDLPSTSGCSLSEEQLSNSEKLRAVVAAAVEKAITEKADPNINREDIISKLDTNALLKDVLSETIIEEEKSVDKKKKLYLPPPGAPSYQPTPISQLKQQRLSSELGSISQNEEEYTPTYVNHGNLVPEDSETTDFSSENEDISNDFDILDEVFTELSSDPVRKKAIQKRKKALGKLSSKAPKVIAPKKDFPKKTPEPKKSYKPISPIHEPEEYENFLPPSPVFTSSSNSYDQELLSRIKASSMNAINETTVETISPPVKTPYEPPPPIKHNILPQIVQLTRPNVKEWSPLVKLAPVKDLKSVEKMLEAFDSISPIREKIPNEIDSKFSEVFKGEHNCKRTRPPDLEDTCNTQKKKFKDDLNISSNTLSLNNNKIINNNLQLSTSNDELKINDLHSASQKIESLACKTLKEISIFNKTSTSKHKSSKHQKKQKSKHNEINSTKSKDRSSSSSRHSSSSSKSHKSKSRESSSSKSSKDHKSNSKSDCSSSVQNPKEVKPSKDSSEKKLSKSSSHSSEKNSKSSSKSHVSSSHKEKSKSHEKVPTKHSSSSNHKRKSSSSEKTSKNASHKDRSSNSSSKTKHKSKTKSSAHQSKEKFKNKVSLASENDNETEFALPDLASVLDELPDEDWDKLMVNNEDPKSPESDFDTNNEDTILSEDDDDDNMDANDPQVLDECMKMFSEYKPEDKPVINNKKENPKESKKKEKEKVAVGKVRVAHKRQEGAPLRMDNKPLIKPHRKTPAEVMMERYKKLKEEEQALQRKLELQRKALEKHVKDPLLVQSLTSPLDTTQSPVVRSKVKRRVARAPSNVAQMLQSKEDLKKRMKIRASSASSSSTKKAPDPPPTTVYTKGLKRVAHKPTTEFLEKPIICIDSSSKVPQNIRQRYLNCFIDEVTKFAESQQLAHQIASAEEKVCHDRCTSRMVYLNLAVNTLKRLRSKTISDAAQEALQAQDAIGASSSVESTNESSPKKKFKHPVNPNHRTVSHYSVMASGGQKGTWSIQKNRKIQPSNDVIKGVEFYKGLNNYILTAEQLAANGYPLPDPSTKGKAILKHINSRKKISPSEVRRYCSRCNKVYEVDEWGVPMLTSNCVHHWGRPYKQRGACGFETRYSCCQGDTQSDGCCLGNTHVSDNFRPDHLVGYVRTMAKDGPADGNYGVYALDCEMCYTTNGNELSRITVIDSECKTVYETLVLPDNPIIDFNTRFSGISAEDMEGVTVSIRNVQAALLTRFSSKTILIGHSLESDFSALKLIHDTVIDTSVIFPHKMGPPYKRALRNLASEYLKKIIQNDIGGHDSAEDALVCMELMQWKIKEDLKMRNYSL